MSSTSARPLDQWRQSFPYPQPRENQTQAIQILSDNWDKYDVFIIRAPTAFGKSAFAKTLMNSLYNVSLITPTNLLVEQFREEFPETCSLSRLDSYNCEEWRRPCPVTRGKLLKFCKGCSASKDLSTAKYRKGPGVYNYHTYVAHKIYRDVLVVDEAHNLIPFLRDRMAITIWQHDYKYPHNMYRPDQIEQWISTLSTNKQNNKKIQILRNSISDMRPEYVLQRTTQEFNGRGTVRGEPEMRDCIRLLPVDISQAPPIFWPKEVSKVVLMSATIGEKDIEQLGLGGRRRVCYIDCKSPIHPDSRPIIFDPVVSVNRNNMEQAAVELSKYIQQIAADRLEEKGVIHATYQMAALLRRHLTDSRYIYHDRDSKRDMYRLFRESPPATGKVLIASGMYEGIDLPEDLGRWQVISKIPWMSLGNPAIAHMASLDPDYYLWECMKTTIQACGRICRTPEDYGESFILDRSFWRLLRDGEKFLPEYFSEAIIIWDG